MPEYVYRCRGCGSHRTVKHKMNYEGDVSCEKCGEIMRRVPQLLAVTWGQLPPSAGELHPNVKHLINNASERREGYEARMEQRRKAKLATGAA